MASFCIDNVTVSFSVAAKLGSFTELVTRPVAVLLTEARKEAQKNKCLHQLPSLVAAISTLDAIRSTALHRGQVRDDYVELGGLETFEVMYLSLICALQHARAVSGRGA